MFSKNGERMVNNNLLIIGAGVYGIVASEVAADMGCFEKIDFVDDEKTTTMNGKDVLGTTEQLAEFADHYSNDVVAIGEPGKRLSLLKRIEREIPCRIVVLVSPKAYISPSAKIGKGSIIEPMAVLCAGCVISEGCIISAGAVINHYSTCLDGVHVDCNAVVEGAATVPAETKVCSGEVFKKTDGN